MNAWFTLTKKEFRLGLPIFLTALILFAGSIGAGYFAGGYYGFREELLLISFGFVLAMHVFFMLVYLFYSLNYERKVLHLWLHNPMSIAGLLSSKIFTGFIYMVITFSACLSLFVLLLDNSYILLDYINAYDFLGAVTLTIFYFGLFTTFNFLLFWSIFLVFSQKTNDFLSFLLAMVSFFFLSWVYHLFIDLPFMQAMTNWGGIQFNNLINGLEFHFSAESIKSNMTTNASILYIGNVVRDFIVSIIIFFVSCFIIDKKVEV